VARLSLAILNLRNAAFPEPASRDAFDKAIQIAFSEFWNARNAVQALCETWKTHVAKLADGSVAQIRGRTIQIAEDIDRELAKQVAALLNASVRGLKQGMQDVANSLGMNIGFLFQEERSFDPALADLGVTDPNLAESPSDANLVVRGIDAAPKPSGTQRLEASAHRVSR